LGVDLHLWVAVGIDQITPVKVDASLEESGLGADLHGAEAYASEL
jgi:hypothetical protein